MKQVTRYAGTLLSVIVLAGSVFALINIQGMYDWWRLKDYTPTQEIEYLAKSSGMTKLGEKLFYVHDPKLLDKTNFRDYCTFDEATIVLGCYISGQNIYVYDVSDERLEGTETVTAAHEMLHAAYDRLSNSEKEQVNQMLKDAYDRLDDVRIQKNVAIYKAQDPDSVMNELHSILGTEVRTLPKDLEEYYKKYFDNRSKVVELSEGYEEEFTKRIEQIEEYDDQLSQLNGDISRLQAELTVLSGQLSVERARLDSLRQSNVAAYNASIGSFNSLVKQYNSGVERVRSLVEQYNRIVEDRNAIAVEEKELTSAIDTRELEL